MADWQILIIASAATLTLAGLSFIFHLKTPEARRSKGIIQPFSFILLVSILILITGYILFLIS